MDNTLTSVFLLVALIAMVLLGRVTRRHLPDQHLSEDSKKAVATAMGLVATMTALLLGLLVSSAKETYDTERTDVIRLAAKVALLDRLLLEYGPDAATAQSEFREGVVEAVGRMWPVAAGEAPRLMPDQAMGDRVYSAIERLAPKDSRQRDLKTQAVTLTFELAELRALLVAQLVPSIPRPMVMAVSGWLVLIFLSFSVLAPPNATTMLSMIAAALSVAVAVFLILELDQPMGGIIRTPGEPMLHAVQQFAN